MRRTIRRIFTAVGLGATGYYLYSEGPVLRRSQNAIPDFTSSLSPSNEKEKQENFEGNIQKSIQEKESKSSSFSVSIDQILEDSKNLTFSQKTSSEDYVLLINVDHFNEQFLKNVEEVLEKLLERNKNLKFFSVKSEEVETREELKAALDPYSFAVFKKSASDAEVFSALAFLTSKSDLLMYFLPLKMLESLADFPLSKGEFTLTSCGKNEKAIRSLESMRSLLPQAFTFDYASCEALQGTAEDLFILRKYSPTHSLNEESKKEIDGRTFDIFRVKSFFADFSAQTKKEKVREVQEVISKNSVFNPLSQEDVNWSFLLEFDYNNTPKRLKREAFKALKEFYLSLDEDVRKKLTISYHHEPLSRPRLRVANRFKMRIYEMNHLSHSKESLEEMKRNFQFLKNEENNVWFYKYPYAYFSKEKIAKFYKECLLGNVSDFHQSEKETFWKTSVKQTFETFGKMARDGKDHVVLLYTASEESKPVRMLFEKLCMENHEKRKYPELEFNRVNIDKNSLSEPPTKIIFVKKNIPSVLPMISSKLSREEIHNFIDTLSHVRIDDSILHIFKDKANLLFFTL